MVLHFSHEINSSGVHCTFSARALHVLYTCITRALHVHYSCSTRAGNVYQIVLKDGFRWVMGTIFLFIDFNVCLRLDLLMDLLTWILCFYILLKQFLAQVFKILIDEFCQQFLMPTA